MANDDLFKYVAIDEDEHERDLQESTQAHKGNPMPRRLLSLEKIYDLQNYFKGPTNAKTHNSTLLHEQVNLGTKGDPKYVNHSMHCSPQE